MLDHYWFTQFLQGVLSTCGLTFSALGIGFVLAITMTYVRIRKIMALAQIVQCLSYIIRGTPLLIQLYIIYYGLPEINCFKNSWVWLLLQSPWVCAITALAMNTAAYTHHLFLEMIRQMPYTQQASALLLGLHPIQAYRFILLPQVLRKAWPAYQNEIFIMLKSTALASTITLMEITGTTKMFIAQTYQTLTGYAIAGALYLLISYLLLQLLRHFVKLKYH